MTDKFFVVVCESGREILLATKYKLLCPILRVEKKIRHRKSKKPVFMNIALFPTYVFVPCDADRLAVVLEDPYVFHALKMDGAYALVSKDEVDFEAIDVDNYVVGQEIKLTKGKARITGKYIGEGKIEINFFGRNFSLSIT